MVDEVAEMVVNKEADIVVDEVADMVVAEVVDMKVDKKKMANLRCEPTPHFIPPPLLQLVTTQYLLVFKRCFLHYSTGV